MQYEIISHHKGSWSYIYSKGGKKYEMWAESPEKLKTKVLNKNLPWNSYKVPKPTKRMTKNYYTDYRSDPTEYYEDWY